MTFKFQHLLKILLVFSLAVGCAFYADAETKLLRRKEALLIAEQSPEGQAFYALNDGKFVNCIEKSVMKPCETNWVTCIEDAWVVKLEYGTICGFKHDERMNLMIVVSAKDGSIISKYPEAEYFTTPQHCQNDNDCLITSNENKEQCINFVYGQLNQNSQPSVHCQCITNQCSIEEKK